MKAAIIGARGQLGSDLVKIFGKEAVPLTHEDIEVTSIESCKILKEIAPNVVINTAAFHKTDACEDFPEKTFSVNAVGAKNVAEVCREINAISIYISTDYVFDGNKNEAYVESDLPNPINVYGISKYAGEIFTKNYCEKHYIIRVASLFGVAGASGKGGNFIETMITKAKKGEAIKVVNDMIMSPTYTKDAAFAIKEIITKELPFGVYHVTNRGSCSWFEFAETIFEILKLDVDLKPIKTEELSLKAKRPKNSSLKSEKLEKFGIELRNWKEALIAYLLEKGHLK